MTAYLKIIVAAVAAFSLATSLQAQSIRHLDEVFKPRSYASLEEWLGRADSLRTHILVSTGLWPLPERTPLSPRVSEPLVRDGYTIQDVVLETRPGFFLTGNLYRPRAGAGPFPAVLSTHGHWDEGRFEDTDLASVPGRAIQFARMGFVVFTISMVGYNETADLLPHRFNDPRYELWGFSVMGLQLWNGMRALDFLTSLPDVDAERIGMTGASGGGTQTFMLTAVDPRIKAAAPVNMISAHMQGGCVCENAPLLRLDADNIDIGGLAAPRPLLMVSTSGDWTRNSPEVEYPAMQAIYRLFGAEDRVANIHLDYPHNYNADSRAAVYSWFARWLQDRDEPISEAPFDVEDVDVLSADVPEGAHGLEGLFENFRKASVRRLGDAKPAGWPEIQAYRDGFGLAFRHAFLVPPPTTGLDLDVRVPEKRTKAGRAVLVVHSGEGLDMAAEVVRGHEREGRMVFVLNPYPRKFEPPDSIHHWTTYNPTTAARRVDEIRRAVEQIQARADVTDLDLVGVGEAGPWTLLARALVADVRNTVIDFNGFSADDDAEYLDRLFVPLLRRVGDFRTAAVLIVPDRLTVNRLPSGALRTWIADVYRAAGASEMVRFE